MSNIRNLQDKIIDALVEFDKDDRLGLIRLTFEKDDLVTLLEALEKQKQNEVINNGYDVYFCPKCKGSVWQIRHESEYCFRCGQALDWKE